MLSLCLALVLSIKFVKIHLVITIKLNRFRLKRNTKKKKNKLERSK